MVVIYDKDQLNELKNAKGDTIIYKEGSFFKIVKYYQRKGTTFRNSVRVSVKSDLKTLVNILVYAYGYDIKYKEREDEV
jgi:hypothetical protein